MLHYTAKCSISFAIDKINYRGILSIGLSNARRAYFDVFFFIFLLNVEHNCRLKKICLFFFKLIKKYLYCDDWNTINDDDETEREFHARSLKKTFWLMYTYFTCRFPPLPARRIRPLMNHARRTCFSVKATFLMFVTLRKTIFINVLSLACSFTDDATSVIIFTRYDRIFTLVILHFDANSSPLSIKRLYAVALFLPTRKYWYLCTCDTHKKFTSVKN